MITFKLLDSTTSKDTIVQINLSHIVSSETVVDIDWVEELNSQCHLAYSTYHLVTGKQLQVCIAEPAEYYDREEFIHFLDRSVSFKTTFIKWSK